MKLVLILSIVFLAGCESTVTVEDPVPCTEAADCDDGDPCTVNRCRDDGTCDNSRIGGECLQ